MFYVGQKVVCVDADSGSFLRGGSYKGVKLTRDMHGLVKGGVFTVRAVGINHLFGDHALWLCEIRRPYRIANLGEVGFNQSRFRPLVERKTDISIFTDMLKSKTEQVSA